jgi:KUP system potassium uptake protein
VSQRTTAQAALAVGALGVVFGDIGTSPLYTIQTVFNPGDPHPVKVSTENIFGVVSLGIFGASLFFGDSMITPAISVLSAIEGVKVAAPSVAALVVPITAAIIVVLFLVQHLGTGAVGRLFGPVMGIWFAAIGLLGVRGIAAHPAILKALSPTYALILDDPSAIRSPFFLLAPAWAQLPMVVLAAAATVIASQAVITGAFSVAHQAARIGYLPRLRVAYTSEETMGQIYVPWINWLLLVAVLTLVVTFRSSAALAYAFGMAVTGTITITTLLFFYVARYQWRWPWRIVAPAAAFLLTVDLLFFAANLTKLVSGAWLPLLIAIVAFTVMTTWQKGRELVTVKRDHEEGPLRAFVDHLHGIRPPLHRVPGTAVFLNRGQDTAPLALRANVEHNQILHQHVVILAIATMPVPHVPAAERITVDELGYKDDRIVHVTARFGYMDQQDVPARPLHHARAPGRERVAAQRRRPGPRGARALSHHRPVPDPHPGRLVRDRPARRDRHPRPIARGQRHLHRPDVHRLAGRQPLQDHAALASGPRPPRQPGICPGHRGPARV